MDTPSVFGFWVAEFARGGTRARVLEEKEGAVHWGRFFEGKKKEREREYCWRYCKMSEFNGQLPFRCGGVFVLNMDFFVCLMV